MILPYVFRQTQILLVVFLYTHVLIVSYFPLQARYFPEREIDGE